MSAAALRAGSYQCPAYHSPKRPQASPDRSKVRSGMGQKRKPHMSLDSHASHVSSARGPASPPHARYGDPGSGRVCIFVRFDPSYARVYVQKRKPHREVGSTRLSFVSAHHTDVWHSHHYYIAERNACNPPYWIFAVPVRICSIRLSACPLRLGKSASALRKISIAFVLLPAP